MMSDMTTIKNMAESILGCPVSVTQSERDGFLNLDIEGECNPERFKNLLLLLKCTPYIYHITNGNT